MRTAQFEVQGGTDKPMNAHQERKKPPFTIEMPNSSTFLGQNMLLSRLIVNNVLPVILRQRGISGSVLQTTGLAQVPCADAKRPRLPRKNSAAYKEKLALEEFVDALMGDDERAVGAVVNRQIGSFPDKDAVLVDFFAPAARLLGQRWEQDTANFAEVTVGLTRLHRLLKSRIAQRIDGQAENAHGTALISSLPGEQHMLGAIFAADIFRRGGWDVHNGTAESGEPLETVVARRFFDIIGLSVTSHAALDTCRSLIAKLRTVSANKNVLFIAGGYAVEGIRDPGLSTGADETFIDIHAALHHCDAFVFDAQTRSYTL